MAACDRTNGGECGLEDHSYCLPPSNQSVECIKPSILICKTVIPLKSLEDGSQWHSYIE